MKITSLFQSAMAAIALTALSAQGALVSSLNDVTYWAGSGSNEAAMVIQFNDGNSPQSIVWGYRWDGAATAQDMLFAIAGNISVSEGAPLPEPGMDARLEISLTYYSSFGFMLDGINYVQVGLGGDFTPVIRSQDNVFGGDSWTLYTLGTQEVWPTGAVMPATEGMSTLSLGNGSWYGWSFTNAFLPPDYDPVAFTFGQPTAAVPEPGVIWLLVAGGVLLCSWKRIRRETDRI